MCQARNLCFAFFGHEGYPVGSFEFEKIYKITLDDRKVNNIDRNSLHFKDIIGMFERWSLDPIWKGWKCFFTKATRRGTNQWKRWQYWINWSSNCFRNYSALQIWPPPTLYFSEISKKCFVKKKSLVKRIQRHWRRIPGRGHFGTKDKSCYKWYQKV